MHGRPFRVDNATLEVRRDYHGDRNLAAAQHLGQHRRGLNLAHDIDDLGFTQLRHELARQVRIGLVRDRRAQVTHVGIDRVAEQQQLDHGDADDHPECQPIAAQLAHFLLGDGKQPVQ